MVPDREGQCEGDGSDELEHIVAAGNQLVKGVQFSVVGRLPRGMDLVAGYAYLDSAVIYSKFFPTSVGYPLANVPKQTFNRL